MKREHRIYRMRRLTEKNRRDYRGAQPTDLWVVYEVCGGKEVVCGFITDTIDFQLAWHLRTVPGGLAEIALPAFISHAAYDRVRRREDDYEVIPITIPEVPGLWGLLGAGWPPRELWCNARS